MSYTDRSYRIGFGGGLTTAIKYLLIANGVVFILQMLSRGDNGEQILVQLFGMQPSLVISKFHIWQLFTYMYLHGDPLHIIFNMFFLWMFGCEVERALGTKEFFKFYTICGIGAGLFHLLINFNSPIAFGVLFPDRVITLLLFLVLPVQMKAKYLVMIFAGIALLLGTFGSHDGVAHFAHLGGMIVAFVYLKLDWRLDYFGKWVRQQRESRKAIRTLKKHQDLQNMRERVDEILDKINEVGYEHLDSDEKRILREASQKFSQEKEPEN